MEITALILPTKQNCLVKWNKICENTLKNSKALWKSKVLLPYDPFLIQLLLMKWKDENTLACFPPFKTLYPLNDTYCKNRWQEIFYHLFRSQTLIFLYGSCLYCNALSVSFVHSPLMGRKQVICEPGVWRHKMCSSCSM